MYHALALIGLGLAPLRGGCRRRKAAGVFFLLGVCGFSGGLYVYTLLQQRWVGMSIVPLGGACFIVGWGLFAWAALSAPVASSPAPSSPAPSSPEGSHAR